jgi:hypothetical protein
VWRSKSTHEGTGVFDLLTIDLPDSYQFDVERGVLTGAIIERQKDHDLGDWKYLIQGQTVMEQQVIVVAKLSPTNKLVIITVYLE